MLKEMKTLKDKVDNYMQFTFEQLCDAVEELDCAISDVMENTNSFDEFIEKSISLREDIDAATIAKVMKQTGKFVKYEMMDEFDQDCVMPRQSFVEDVKNGLFTNDDGYGMYAKDRLTITNVPCVPSDIEAGYIRKDFEYVVWWNK